MSCSFSKSYRQPLFLLVHFHCFPKFSLNSKSTFTCQVCDSPASDVGVNADQEQSEWHWCPQQTHRCTARPPYVLGKPQWIIPRHIFLSDTCIKLKKKYTEVIFNSNCLKTAGYTGCHFKLYILWWNLASARSSNSDSHTNAEIIFLFSSPWISLLPFFDEICTLCCSAQKQSWKEHIDISIPV